MVPPGARCPVPGAAGRVGAPMYVSALAIARGVRYRLHMPAEGVGANEMP